MIRVLALGLTTLLLAGSCARHTPSASVAQTHYVLGEPYQAGGVWHYPREQYGVALTGLAVVDADTHPKLTADGEVFDPTALAASHRTLQLPAVARLTDLETGRRIVVRVNDRGPEPVGRLIAVTPRVAALLGFPAGGVARVRLDVLAGESHDAADGLPGAPRLAIEAAPREAVRAETLGPVGGPRAEYLPAVARVVVPDGATPARRLSEPTARSVTQEPPAPGQLYVRLSRFTDLRYAARQAALVPGAHLANPHESGPASFRSRSGPFATVGEADAALDQAIRAGVSDARIVVE